MAITYGYIYFGISTHEDGFTLDKFKEYLSLDPTSFKNKFENKGKSPTRYLWRLEEEQKNEPNIYEEISVLISKLIPHKQELIELKNAHSHLEFVLEVVLFCGENSPALGLDSNAIKFLNDVGAEFDVDMYNMQG